jgi:NAD(P)-dependent dehydrogenase (short-subunit alcohol dehydrogenase family)
MEPGGKALVTGANRGIGRATAIELARRGFEVLAGARDPSACAPFDQATITPVRLDVTDLESFEVPDDLRVLVNNAGVRLDYLPVEETPLEQWRATFEANVFGLAELCRRAIPALRRSAPSVLCNVSSSSVLLPLPFFAVYRASKAAVSAVTDSLRIELAPLGVRVIEILPGPIDTDMMATSVMSRPPDAVRFPAYAPMASRPMGNGNVAIVPTPAAAAATAIVDAILSDDPTLRYACDPVSAAHLARWRASSDEAVLQEMLGVFGVD